MDVFGRCPAGEVVQITLKNAQGVAVDVLNLGAIIRAWRVPMGDAVRDIVLGFDSIEPYLSNPHYIGVVVGRYANRIGTAMLSIDGQNYVLDANESENCLHSGSQGWHQRLWQVLSYNANAVTLGLRSADGDQGFPGAMDVQVTYTLGEDNSLHIRYQATTEKTTVFGPTQHSYFNLDGHHSGTVGQHQLQIHAEHYTPLNSAQIPTGEIAPIAGTPLDFRHPQRLQNILESELGGLDFNWCLHQHSQITKPIPAARLVSSDQLLRMQVSTTMPGLQIYTGNYLPPAESGKGGVGYQAHQGICLETQMWPDAPNKKGFPSPLLARGKPFVSETCYQLVLAGSCLAAS